MPLSIPRLRTWFAILGLATAVAVAGFYFYARIQLRKMVRNVPEKLGVEVQQSTEGFSLSKSEGGRTLFTVRASKAVQFKEGGKAQLQDVNIVVYGRNSDRFDQISGSGFEYDPQAGTISARGEVNIDLESNLEGPVTPDQAPPKELKNPIHLKTSGLVFNQKTGFAYTNETIEFRVPQASGSALGATYDSKVNLLTLKSNVKIQTSGERGSSIEASRGEITNEPRRMVLDSVRIIQPDRDIEANQVIVDFRQDNTVDHVRAAGAVRLAQKGTNSFALAAPRADLDMLAKNLVQRAVFSGGVQISGSGDNQVEGTAGKLTLSFDKGNRLSHVQASENVQLSQVPAKGHKGDAYDLFAQAVDFNVAGNHLESGQTSGPAKFILKSQNAKQGEQTTVTAGRFTTEFGQRNRLKTLRGEPDARIAATSPGQPDKVSTSKLLLVQFAPGGGVSNIVQQGDFRYVEPSAKPGTGERNASAESARYDPSDETLVLAGSPRITDGGLTVSANSIRLNRRTGDAFADGDVKSTYSELKQNPTGALLATAEPVHVTSRSMNALRKSGIARYTGGARLWQGANIVEAPAIEFDREQRSIVAQGNGKPVSSVFVQQDKSGKVTPIVITATKLTYVDSQRRARYTGGVIAKGADVTVTANTVDVVLNQSGGRTSGAGPSQLNQIVATNNVVIQEPNRRATGEQLVYTAADGKFVLTGGPPAIADAEHGTIRGDSLTFYSHDDRIVVESKESSRTVTRTRVVR